MPKKIRELKKLIQDAGYIYQPKRGKGSHTFWTHPQLPDDPLVIPGKDGDDAPKYLEKEVAKALKRLESLEDSEE
ncbi:type II toxin-antitoxin system HicA family toxin [Leptolyngbya sp. AN03gr2]|uniref:type II toxin-antitoxin system HicA family toxin n=1 Tax=unclassified Leptolyngbya TaxID=2650499 RepID=UPI003D321D5C